ncbi:hypothetical protein GCM10008023_38810 [Sphingomonas glacialis]|uniref:Uncharacterized protein n=1 Tax=Sphingomonas glacialis TaxID=658225 RepID=A0ABQ3LTA9_9SPHN|nr:hypothetical protein [Sphingomonas glacialis]GHH25423.1 hypothetical protein GCM10008023_38810 [Sphingomonas glacialis]
MFNDIWIARKNAMSLAKTLMVATMVIAVGTGYSVITAENHDSSVVVVNGYDPFAYPLLDIDRFARRRFQAVQTRGHGQVHLEGPASSPVIHLASTVRVSGRQRISSSRPDVHAANIMTPGAAGWKAFRRALSANSKCTG